MSTDRFLPNGKILSLLELLEWFVVEPEPEDRSFQPPDLTESNATENIQSCLQV